jgi:CheY-like chemotaxis protein
MSLRILFLDDSMERQKKFRMSTIGWDITCVTNYEDCINALASHRRFDCVFLDHDLNPETEGNPGPDEKTGADVARFIVSMPESLRPKEAIVHSLNKPGRERIVDILRDAGIPTRNIPGAWAQIVRDG